ncbi:MAG: DUF402 domain-containing protein [Dehalococcoidia bacterium]|nr:DUF402 domain-containing protein [Dehalococcoidia bacterium]
MPPEPEQPLLPPLDDAAAGTPIRVLSTKYDGSPHYDYWARLIDQHGSVIRVVSEAGTPTSGYRGNGVLRSGMTQLFFTDRWYNVFHNYDPVGRLGMHWYANIGTPARIEGDTLHWIDLDLDLMCTNTLKSPLAGQRRWHRPGANGDGDAWVFVDDEDEFAEHREQMAYPLDVVEHAEAALEELLALSHDFAFPLDHASHLPPEVLSRVARSRRG